MATQDKVISFEQAKQKDGQKTGMLRLVAEMRTLYSRHLTELLQRLFTVIDDELFKRSNSESMTQQTLYFEMMRQIRVEAASLQANYHGLVARHYEDFWRKRSPLHSGSESDDGLVMGLNSDGFSLVENEVLEEEIAVTSMAEKGNNLFQNQLLGLNKRFAVMIEREELDNADNPLAPQVLCAAFAETLQPLAMTLPIKLLIFKLFDQVVLSGFGALYQELNNYLINEGILPTLNKGAKRPVITPASPYAAPQAPGATEETIEENQQAYAEMFQGMQRLMEGWRAQMGLMSSLSELATGPAFETGEVLSVLSNLQVPVTAQLGTEGLKPMAIREHLIQHSGGERSLGRSEEDIIDMVALIFDFILEDRNLPDPIKGLIARLQIPVVKVAIIEKSFFGRKNHPVRLLLNALAQAGIGLDTSEGVTETPVFKKIEVIVSRVLDEFDQNVGLFSDLLDEFTAFMEKEIQRSRVAEDRTRQVTQSKEQLHLAKRKIAYEIASRLEGKVTPAAVRSFLYNTWKDVMVLAYLRRDKQPGDWETALKVMDKLIWSVIPPPDVATRKAIVQIIPKLLKAVRAGLESISLDPQSVANALKDLEACHVACLSHPLGEAPEPGMTLGAEGSTVPLESDDQPVEIRDPELAQVISEIKGNLPDIENLTLQDLCKPADDIGGFGTYTSSPDFVVEDEWVFKARALEVGEWVEFDEGKKKIRGKLSWKSQVTSTYVFVNRKGAKVLEIPLSDLAHKMGNDEARVIEDTGTPLMDRAFGALFSKLKSSPSA